MSEQNSDKQQSIFLKLDKVIIAAIPIIAYLVVFIFESAYLRVFNIPNEFIVVSWTQFFIVTGSMITLIFAVFCVCNAVYITLPGRFKKNNPFLVIFTPLILLVITDLTIFNIRWEKWVWSVVLLILVLWGFYQKNKRKKLLEKETTKANRQYLEDTESLLDLFFKKFGKRNLGILLYLLVFSAIVLHFGEAVALKNKRFIVINGSPELVVIRIYGDNLICIPFDRNSKRLLKGFLVLKVGANQNLILKSEDVGPLVPADK